MCDAHDIEQHPPVVVVAAVVAVVLVSTASGLGAMNMIRLTLVLRKN